MAAPRDRRTGFSRRRQYSAFLGYVLAVAGALWWLWHYIQATNVALARFIDSVRFGDFTQGFAYQSYGSGFAELGAALDEALRKLRGERHTLTEANRFYEAVLDDAPTALLTVESGGPLLDPAQVARLGQPFQRLGVERTAGGGTGLGLSIVAAIAAAHGGTLALRARPEGGLHVAIRLPLRAGTAG